MKNAVDTAPMLIVTKLLKRVRAIGTISEEAINLQKCLKARKNALQKVQNQSQERDSLSLNASDSIEDSTNEPGALEITVHTTSAKQDTPNMTTNKNDDRFDPNTPGSSGSPKHIKNVLKKYILDKVLIRSPDSKQYPWQSPKTNIQERRESRVWSISV